MEHFELVEKLVNTFGVSYEEAKNALEKSDWDPVDAAVILERIKNGTYVNEEPQPEVNTNRKGSFCETQCNWKQESEKFVSTVWNFLSLNEFVVKKPSGEVFLELPIWIAALLLCAFFWAILFILGIVFIMGYRFSFTGPQLGKWSGRGPKGSVDQVKEDVVEPVAGEGSTNEEPKPEQPKETPAETIIPEQPKETPAETVIPEQPKETPAETVIPEKPEEPTVSDPAEPIE